jgi:Anti-sigma factor NepR
MRSKGDPEDKTENMQPEHRDIGPSFYERAIRTTIGRGLRSYYDLAEPIPDEMTKLLRQIDDRAPSAGKRKTPDAVQKQKDNEPKSD